MKSKDIVNNKVTQNKFSAIILAAGLGSRLINHTKYTPKAMVSVKNRLLIDYAVECVLNSGIQNLYVVGGYMGNKLQQHIIMNYPEIKFFINDNFRLGNILSLASVIDKIVPPFILMNVDHIYPYALLKKFLKSKGSIMAAVDFDRQLGSDDMKVKLNKINEIASISKQLTDFDCGYIGMTLVRPEGFNSYRKAFHQVMAQRCGMASVEEIIGELTNTFQKVQICDLSGFGWLEIDTEDELSRAEQILTGHPDFFKNQDLDKNLSIF